MPAWELNQIPGYAQGNVARAMLDQQRNQQQGNQHPQTGGHRRPRNYPPSVVYVLPQYRYFSESLPTTTQFVPTPPPPTMPVAAEPVPPPPPMGALRLDVEPKESLQIYVDGVYLGTPADLGDQLQDVRLHPCRGLMPHRTQLQGLLVNPERRFRFLRMPLRAPQIGEFVERLDQRRGTELAARVRGLEARQQRSEVFEHAVEADPGPLAGP